MIPFGLEGLLSASVLGRSLRTEEGRAWLAGVAAHSMAPLSKPLTGAYGLWFTILAHAYGWPVVKGGSAELTKALAAEIVSRGGRVETGRWVRHIADLPSAQVVLLDVSPAQLITMAGSRLPARYVQTLRRFHYGPGVCKVDWALAGPVPWQAAACRSAGTVHLGGPMTEIAASESDVAYGRHPDRPFSIIVQAGVIDSSRAPQGKQALYGYCHVPNGSTRNMANQIEAQIERFAPGFRDLILARSVRTAADLESYNPNYVGGDIAGGLTNFRQTLFRPTVRWNPYRLPLPGMYLCSASTPPGAGVHGMCGMNAAKAVLADLGMARSTMDADAADPS